MNRFHCGGPVCQADRGTVRPDLAPDLDGGLSVPADIEPL